MPFPIKLLLPINTKYNKYPLDRNNMTLKKLSLYQKYYFLFLEVFHN